jgi:hypothetical protein
MQRYPRSQPALTAAVLTLTVALAAALLPARGAASASETVAAAPVVGGPTMHWEQAANALTRLKTSSPQLHALITTQQGFAYRAGATFPDLLNATAAAIFCAKNEALHSGPFLTEYAERIHALHGADLGDGQVSSEAGKKLIAHFMGCIAHIVGDFRFDRYFLDRTIHECGKEQGWTDFVLDKSIGTRQETTGLVVPPNPFVANPLAKLTPGWLAASMPDEIASIVNSVQVGDDGQPLPVTLPVNNLDLQLKLGALVTFANTYRAFDVIETNNLGCDWGRDNWQTGVLGSVTDVGAAIAEYQKEAWDILVSGGVPEFSRRGGGRFQSLAVGRRDEGAKLDHIVWVTLAGPGDGPVEAFRLTDEVRKFQLDGERVGALLANGELAVKTGRLDAPWRRVPATFDFTEGPSGFTYDSGWRVGQHPRLLADVNGDGKQDIVGFGYTGMGVALAKRSGVGFEAGPGLPNFGFNAESGAWDAAKHPRMLGDVNGDGRADVVGIHKNGVYLALATDAGFEYHSRVLEGAFGYDSGWRVDKHPRVLADVNGDGRQDIVGFAGGGTLVALAKAAGVGFESTTLYPFFGADANVGAWDAAQHLRLLGDVNGDGRADIVGFHRNGVYLALATDAGFEYHSRVLEDSFGYDSGWRNDMHPRVLADVSGDGKVDIVAFGHQSVSVAQASALPLGRKIQDFSLAGGGIEIRYKNKSYAMQPGQPWVETRRFGASNALAASVPSSMHLPARGRVTAAQKSSELTPDRWAVLIGGVLYAKDEN